jgi:IS605 OrfB family transposase
VPVVQVSFANGSIGIDLNADHVAVAYVNRDGSLEYVRRIAAVMQGKTSGHRRALIYDIVADLVAHALGMPLVIEDLDFTTKRRRLKDLGDARQARMLSSFGYSRFRTALIACAKRNGVAVMVVNPAWTSDWCSVSRRRQWNFGASGGGLRHRPACHGNGGRGSVPNETFFGPRQTCRARATGTPAEQGAGARGESLRDARPESLAVDLQSL